MKARWTSSGSHRLFAREWTESGDNGSPLSVVLVHGLGVSSRYMIPTAERLCTTRRVFAPDLPGFGRSEAPRSPLTLADHARILGEWMDACDIRQPVLVGNSFGCQVIVELVMQRPGWARAMVLSAPTVEASRRSALGEVARLMSDAPLERLALLPIVMGDYLRAGPRRIISTLGEALRDRIEDKLPHITIPTLLVRGSRDPVVSAEWIEFLSRRTPFATALTLEGAPHAVNFSAAPAFAAAIEDFLAVIERDLA